MTALRKWALCSAAGSGAYVVAIAMASSPKFPATIERASRRSVSSNLNVFQQTTVGYRRGAIPRHCAALDAVLGNRMRMLFSTRDVVELLCPRAGPRHR